MAQDQEKFLSRWARLKQENKLPEKREGKSEEKRDAPAPVLPPLENLTPEGDFSGFMHPKVQDALRRVALKKLFSDPHFNIPDPFEAYSGDWTGGEPIPEEMLRTLAQARNLLFPEEAKQAEEVKELAAKVPEPPQDEDEPRRQDT
jgi:hypothetical protein